MQDCPSQSTGKGAIPALSATSVSASIFFPIGGRPGIQLHIQDWKLVSDGSDLIQGISREPLTGGCKESVQIAEKLVDSDHAHIVSCVLWI